MSWTSKIDLEVWIILAASLAATLWYGSSQLLFSMRFIYQLARYLLPGVVPELGAPG